MYSYQLIDKLSRGDCVLANTLTVKVFKKYLNNFYFAGLYSKILSGCGPNKTKLNLITKTIPFPLKLINI